MLRSMRSKTTSQKFTESMDKNLYHKNNQIYSVSESLVKAEYMHSVHCVYIIIIIIQEIVH